MVTESERVLSNFTAYETIRSKTVRDTDSSHRDYCEPFSFAEVVKNMKKPPRRRLRLRPWTRLLGATSRHQAALLISSCL